VDRLVRHLQDSFDGCRRVAALSLEKTGWEPSGNLEKSLYCIAKWNFEACVAIGKEAIGPLRHMLEAAYDEIPFQSRIIYALGEIGGSDAVDVLVSYIGNRGIISPWLDGPSLGDAAVEALARIGKPAVDSLARLVKSIQAIDTRSREGAIRFDAAKTLEKIAGEDFGIHFPGTCIERAFVSEDVYNRCTEWYDKSKG
jgi:HEAT repeat protein